MKLKNILLPVLTGIVFSVVSFSSNVPLNNKGYETYILPDTQLVALNQGWNIMSSYIDPVQSEMDSVYNDVLSSLLIVKNNDGQVYWPAYGVNQISNYNVTQGYLLKMDIGDTLFIIGDKVDPILSPVPIIQGWNMIAYFKDFPDSISSLLSDYTTNIIIIKNGDGQVYWPMFNLDQIELMKPGKGYQLKANNPDSIFYQFNLPPIAVDDTDSTQLDNPITTVVLNNDYDPDGFIDITSVTVGDGYNGLMQPTNGTVTVDPVTGDITYTPWIFFSGIDYYEYSVCDNYGACDVALVTINVITYTPIAIEDFIYIDEDQFIEIDVIANDINPQEIMLLEIVNGPTFGSAFVNSNNTIEFTPILNYSGLSQIYYQIIGYYGQSSSALVNIWIYAVNDPPTATVDSATTQIGVSVNINVLANDSDPENNIDSTSISNTGLLPPTYGSINISPTGIIIYTPNAGFYGVDQFEYSVSDLGFPILSDTSMVIITVTQ